MGIETELLKRISNLEFEVERQDKVISDLEEHLLKMWNEHKDSECDELYTIAHECMYIYNYLQELKGEDE